jgi:Protein of unknown function (DUF1822)
MNQLNPSIIFPVPLSFSAHTRAEEFRRLQSNPQKAKQVYLNTLAVYAVDFYLRCLEIESTLAQSDSQNPLCLKFMNVADLVVKSIGKLECRPVLPDADMLEIPAEVRVDRVGYVAVQFDQALKQAQIIGFTTTAAATVSLSQLQSIDALPEYLQQLRLSIVNSNELPIIDQTNLRQWLNNYFEPGWQDLQMMFSPDRQKVAFRSTDNVTQKIERGKLIQLITPQTAVAILLVIELKALLESDINVRVQILSTSNQVYLPVDLQVKILDNCQIAVMQATSASTNQNMEFNFTAQLNEQFSIEINLGEISLSENFVA